MRIDQLWYNAIHDVIANPVISSRNGPMRETIGWIGQIVDIDFNFLRNKIRELSISYACAEFLWYMSNTQSTHMLEAYAPSYEKYTDNHKAYGAYGPRIAKSIWDIIELLQKFPDTRQAVMLIWQEGDLKAALTTDTKDIPCTVQLQFFIRDHKLYCISYMRSNDIWLGMPYDIFCFTTLQRIIANELDVAYGSYTHCVGSLHLYEKNYERASAAINNFVPTIPHCYTNDKTTILDIHLALEYESRHREMPHTLCDIALMPPMMQDLVMACRQKFVPDQEHTFHSKAFDETTR